MADRTDRANDAGGADAGGGGAPPLLELRGVTKAFPGMLANDAIDLAVRPGEIHALLGENGAGKSTLVKIVYGVLRPDSGTLLWNGAPVAVSGPAAARRLGVGMVFQHFSLFDAMTVLENIALAVPGERGTGALRARVLAVSAEYGLPLEPDRRVLDLSVGERQRIEIVRCLLQDPKLLILDEPTSVLTPREAGRLFETLRALSAEGRAILYIGHKLEEARSLCETATILRGGRVVASLDPRRETARSLAEAMIGRRPVPPSRGAASAAEARIVVDRLSVPSADGFGVDLREVSLEVRRGELVGVAGVAGNGQAELAAALSGETVLPARPEAILLDGRPAAALGPAARRALGAAFVPERRDGHAAVREMTLAENAFLTAARRMGLAARGLLRPAATRAFAERIVRTFDVRAGGPEAEAGSLSGGNLQKFVVGREILQDPGILVIAQPTWGVDAGAAAAIRQALIDLARRGAAVLVISQDLDEIFEICDRALAMSEGRMSAPRDIDAAGMEEVGLLMAGGGEFSVPERPPMG